MSDSKTVVLKKAFLAFGLIGGILGMLWLASVITARPEETLAVAAKFRGLVWLPFVAAWIVMSWFKKRSRRSSL